MHALQQAAGVETRIPRWPNPVVGREHVTDEQHTLWNRIRPAWGWWRWLSGRRHPLVVVAGSVGVAFGTALGVAGVAGHERVYRVFASINPIWFLVCVGA